MRDRIALLAAAAATAVLGAGTAAAGIGSYVAADWGGNEIHFLDINLNSIGFFGAGSDLPNGVATDGNLIWSGHFTSDEVIAYDFTGAEQFRWSGPGGVQGLEYINQGELAVMDAFAASIDFHDPFTGAFVRSIPTAEGTTVEGLAWDGSFLWQLGTNAIYATDVNTGAVINTIPNAAGGDPFGGTGITSSGLNELTLAAANGNWYKVSKADGSVMSSGNNGIEMYGLAFIPAPGAVALLGVAGLVARRRRRE